MCFNGSCNPNPQLNCPIEAVNENYLFNWNALDYTLSTSIEFSATSDFKSKKSVNVKNLNSLPVKSYYSTLMNYEKSSKENKVYARLVGKNIYKEIKYSETCAFNLTQKTNSILNCPQEPIDESYIFNLEKKDNVNPKIQISYVPEFSTGKNFQMSPKNNQTPIKTYYSKLLDYEKKSISKKLYARATGKDKYGRDTSSNTCEFNLKQQIQPTLTCPVQNIDSTYLFNWNAGDYTSSVTLELSYKTDFKTKTSIIATKLNPTPITKYFKTLQKYALKTTTGELYARINVKDKYRRETTSNICTFKLAGTNLSEEEETNQTAYFKILTKDPIQRLTTPLTHTTTLIKTDANTSSRSTNSKPFSSSQTQNNEEQTNNSNETILSTSVEVNETGDTITKKVIQELNDNGEMETGAIYEITENPLTQYNSNNVLVNSSSTTCTYNSSSKTPCEKKGDVMKLINGSTTLEIRYTYIDCTTGEILGKGQLCPGESGSWHHVPKEHTAKFEYKRYQCPNNGCKTETLDLCSQVTCSNYCLREMKNYNGTCNKGVCNYTYIECPKNCTEGQCTSNNCTAGWKCFNLIEKGYQNSNCDWSDREYCPNECSNGKCNSQTCSTGWKCIDDETKAYQNSNCSWDDEETCTNGCSNGACNSEECTEGWKCYSSTKKGYQNEDCSWENKTTCEYGCSNGECKTNSCSAGWKCMDDETKAYQKSDCSWINDTYCEEGCDNGSCNSKVPGDSDYCTEEEQCEAGEGNCSNGNECQPGLYCMQDVGSNYGYSSSTNVCESKEGVGEWKCYNSNTAGFKFYSDSSWTDKTNCPNGCTNGACVSSILQGTDSDKDGYSNDDEILAGSDPNNFDSTPFTEFAKYSEEIKEITKMNSGDVITNILVPFLAQKQSFENKTTQKINKLSFSGKDTNKAELSMMNTLAGYMGTILGRNGGILIGGKDFIVDTVSFPVFLINSILSFGTYLINLNQISADYSAFIDFLAHSNVTYDSVTGTVDSTGKTLNTIWNSYYGGKFKEGLIISNFIPFIVQDADDQRKFAHSYAQGYTEGYIVTVTAPFLYGAGEVKAAISGIKVGKLGTTTVEVGEKIPEFINLSKWISTKGEAVVTVLKGKKFLDLELDRFLANDVDLEKLNIFASSTKWVDEADEALTLVRGLEKAKGTSAIKQALDNGYEIEKVLSNEKRPDLYLKNIAGKEITMEAKGADVIADSRKIDTLLEKSSAQLEQASGEKIPALLLREGTILSDEEIINQISNWLKNDVYGRGQKMTGVTVQIVTNSLTNEYKLLYIKR